MTGPGRAIWTVLSGASARVRVDGYVAIALAVAALVPAALLGAWVVGGWAVEGVGPIVVWAVLVGAGVTLVVVLGRRWVGAVDERAVTAAAERVRELPEGSLRGILELGRDLPTGTSTALFQRRESELAGRLAGATARELTGELGAVARRRRGRALAGVAGLALAAGALGFSAPDRARGAWLPLLHPVEHLRGPVFPALAVAPGDTAVDRGAMLDVSIEARLRERVTLHWRSVGDVPRERALSVESGRAAGVLGPVAAAVSYWVEAPDGAVSDTFTAHPVDPLLVTDLTIDLAYPPHVDRGPDQYRGDPPALRVPEGTRLRAVARTSRSVVAAGLRGEARRGPRAVVTPGGFELTWTLTAESTGRWEWSLVAEDGARAEGTAPLDIHVIEDAPPRVRIAVPGADTTMPSSLRQPVIAEADDDHGLTAGTLVYRRLAAGGEKGPAVSTDLPLTAVAGRGTLRGVLDASDQPLSPGDAIEYHVVVRDNSPARQTARSRTYVLRLPDMAELRERARQQADEVVTETERLRDRARSLESSTRDLSRNARTQAGERGDRGESRLDYQEASEAKAVAGEHEEALARVDELQARLAELERALADAGLKDPELLRRLRDLRERQSRLASPEMREQVDALRQAAEALDPEAVEAALERLAQEQERFRERIEESLEIMRRAAAEQELSALAREAEDIAAREEALAEAMRSEADGQPAGEAPDAGDAEDSSEASAGETAETEESSDSEEAGESGESEASEESGERPPSPPSVPALQQEELEDRAERLSKSLESLTQALKQMGEKESSTQTGVAKEQGESSRQSMREAARQSREQQGESAAQSAQRAAGQMAEAARSLDEARQQMTEARQRDAQRAVEQATQEALGMAQRQESLRQRMEQEQRQGGARGESLQQMRSDQAALQQGLQQLSRNLTQTSQRSGMIDPAVARALERARMNMERTAEGLQGSRMPVGEAARTVEALNQLAMSLLENEAGSQQASGSSGIEEALRRLSSAAREQGALNDRVGALDPTRLSPRERAQQLAQLGREQRGLARQIGEANGALGGREDVLGRLDQLSAEAARLGQELEGGRLDAEIRQRQERLFHRLLDAGRSLEQNEYSEERVGRSPAEVEVGNPAGLDPALLDPRVRYPAPTAQQLERLPPAYRRLILDYFDRLNRSGADAGGEAAGGGESGDG